MEYRYAERITAHQTILEGAMFRILLVSPTNGFNGEVSEDCCMHLDFAGPFMGHMFLILVDAHSSGSMFI